MNSAVDRKSVHTVVIKKKVIHGAVATAIVKAQNFARKKKRKLPKEKTSTEELKKYFQMMANLHRRNPEKKGPEWAPDQPYLKIYNYKNMEKKLKKFKPVIYKSNGSESGLF